MADFADEIALMDKQMAEEREKLLVVQQKRKEDYLRLLQSRAAEKKRKEEEEAKRKTAAAVAPPHVHGPGCSHSHSSAPAPAVEGCNVANTAQAGKADKCAGCPSKDSCSSGAANKEKTNEVARAVVARMALVSHKILVLSGKGGVGKSMVSTQLAFALAAKGHKVGLMDIDICGATIPKMVARRGAHVFGGAEGMLPVEVTPNLGCMSIGFLVESDTDAVIWRGPRKIGAVQAFITDVAWGERDVLLVDTPPGTSDEHLSIVQTLAHAGIDGAVVVTSPQDVSVVEVGKEIKFCRAMGVPVLGVVENFSSFVCPCCSGVTEIWPATSGGGVALAAEHGVPFLGKVPLDPALSRAGEAGQSLPATSPTMVALNTIADLVAEAVGLSDLP